MVSDEQICVIFRSVSSREHCFSPQVLKTIHTQTPLGGLKMLFLSIRETNGWRVPRLGWGDFHFLALKMQFLPSRETNVSRVPSFVWAHFLVFGDLNMRFLPNRDTHGSRIPRFVWAHFLHFDGLKKLFQLDSLNKRFKGTCFRVSSFSASWEHENAIFAESCNPLFKGTSLS